MSRRTALFLLAILCAVALLLRASGIDYLLPEVMNRDGLVVVRQAEHLRTHERPPGDRAWWYSSYPHLMARIAALLPAARPPLDTPIPLEEHLRIACVPWIQLRWISILLSLLAVPGTYLLARRFLDRASSLFAAALTATSLHHICLSIQEKPHGASASFVLLALLAALRLRRRPDLPSYVLCAAAAALSVSILHSGVIGLLPIAAAFLLRERSGRGASGWWMLAVAAAAAVAVRVAYPFFFEGLRDPSAPTAAVAGPDPAEFARKITGALRGAPVRRLALALFDLDPLLVVAAAAGILLLILRALREPARFRDSLRGDLGVVLALALPTLAVLFLFRGTLVRFFLPFLPVLACASGYAFSRARAVRPAIAGALGILLLAVPLAPAAHFARIRREPGPIQEASAWVVSNVPPGETVVVVPNYDLALLPTEDALVQNARNPYRTIWSEYMARTPRESIEGTRRSILIEPGLRPESRAHFARDPLDYLRRYRARWLVLDLSGGGRHLVRGKAERVVRFSPAREDDDYWRGVVLFGTGFDALAPSARSILRMRSLGTVVEIYRIP